MTYINAWPNSIKIVLSHHKNAFLNFTDKQALCTSNIHVYLSILWKHHLEFIIYNRTKQLNIANQQIQLLYNEIYQQSIEIFQQLDLVPTFQAVQQM